MKGFITDPLEIERESMRIIHGYLQQEWTEQELKVVERCIHTSGDPTLESVIRIHPQGIEAGLKALQQGAPVITDVEMVRAGIAKKQLAQLGGVAECFLSDPRVADQAAEWGITRSMAALRLNKERLKGAIVAIGNAPTALLEVLELAQDPETRPALVVGIPVGFVGARESKDLLWDEHQELPSITILGNRGGSPLAATCVNALIYLAVNREI
ncbi:precorrin-8X methylmutase /cobalt-precorrin 8 methylmutase [Desulfitobacterium sp. LBE]|uniref:Precorrin isomerase n=4 Tax=Desulfitobacterium hafniense TaxID=49338 RepID=Q24Q40_DESHY|nr:MULTISPECIES: precorrin-8X methylmutase [Desulfitobacterium]ACL19359.1 Precorrin-8X methylmutase CbiC/CobH [Desulfitobacterium hafniense DCB-2]EHL06849.1 precorrin-8X methylmutase [Desulfitobacterium hafniense DP7]KTE92577.1 precorrin isomerase [Desulfitobacterium hafniense]TWH57786.1 precorrin-8X methylmutase /cobalt-precorrin 8 methylmutase [Desulfitobacterium sp. LBE]CDX04283.1 Cobalt-precorrin-8X methylmutase [Desulfitobacterium hafniense]